MMVRTMVVAWMMLLFSVGCLAQADTLRHEVIDSDSLFTISSDSVLLQ